MLNGSGYGATSRSLFPLLANSTLSDELVDMMLVCIEQEAHRCGRGSTYIIARTTLWHEICKANDAEYFLEANNKLSRYVRQLPERVDADKVLLMPIIYANHLLLAVATLTFGTDTLFSLLSYHRVLMKSNSP